MKTILVINNNTNEANHAALMALKIAGQLQADIIIANNYLKVKKRAGKVLAGAIWQTEQAGPASMLRHLQSQNLQPPLYTPEISEVDITGMDTEAVAQIINKRQVWMMIKGMPLTKPDNQQGNQITAHAVLNRVLCPLLLVPVNWAIKDIERIVYIADLRYCRLQIVRYLAEIARPVNASLSIAHIAARGLPEIMEPYALQLFSEEVCSNIKYNRLFFNNIKEKNLEKAIDVLVNGMHNDILVLINHRFHFEEIFGRYITRSLPGHINTPLLIFPY